MMNQTNNSTSLKEGNSLVRNGAPLAVTNTNSNQPANASNIRPPHSAYPPDDILHSYLVASIGHTGSNQQQDTPAHSLAKVAKCLEDLTAKCELFFLKLNLTSAALLKVDERLRKLEQALSHHAHSSGSAEKMATLSSHIDSMAVETSTHLLTSLSSTRVPHADESIYLQDASPQNSQATILSSYTSSTNLSSSQPSSSSSTLFSSYTSPIQNVHGSFFLARENTSSSSTSIPLTQTANTLMAPSLL